MSKTVAGETDDRAAIIELIHRNRISIWTGNYALWDTCFVHEPYLTRWGWWKTGGTFIRQGWDELQRLVRASGPSPDDAQAYDTTVEDLNLRIMGDMAWATFTQRYPAGTFGPGLLPEIRIFERHGGAWKIALFGFLDPGAGLEGQRTLLLDTGGAVLWQSGPAQAAIAESDHLVIRNGHLRFRDSRSNSKLQDALRWAAGVDNGYMSARGARPIVVEQGEGLPVSVYWVTIESGMIFFSFGTNALDENRLAAIGLIFGLSPSQIRVAGFIAEGLSLTEIAERLAITANTARTHLERIYEKTGVRSQAALVRVLLSAAAPA